MTEPRVSPFANLWSMLPREDRELIEELHESSRELLEARWSCDNDEWSKASGNCLVGALESVDRLLSRVRGVKPLDPQR